MPKISSEDTPLSNTRSESSGGAIKKICGGPNCDKVGDKMCALCDVMYCSKQCQTLAWNSDHKRSCAGKIQTKTSSTKVVASVLPVATTSSSTDQPSSSSHTTFEAGVGSALGTANTTTGVRLPTIFVKLKTIEQFRKAYRSCLYYPEFCRSVLLAAGDNYGLDVPMMWYYTIQDDFGGMRDYRYYADDIASIRAQRYTVRPNVAVGIQVHPSKKQARLTFDVISDVRPGEEMLTDWSTIESADHLLEDIDLRCVGCEAKRRRAKGTTRTMFSLCWPNDGRVICVPCARNVVLGERITANSSSTGISSSSGGSAVTRGALSSSSLSFDCTCCGKRNIQVQATSCSPEATISVAGAVGVTNTTNSDDDKSSSNNDNDNYNVNDNDSSNNNKPTSVVNDEGHSKEKNGQSAEKGSSGSSSCSSSSCNQKKKKDKSGGGTAMPPVLLGVHNVVKNKGAMCLECINTLMGNIHFVATTYPDLAEDLLGSGLVPRIEEELIMSGKGSVLDD